ncbi:MAG: hypothetical protein Q8P67_22830 [archaeon]|nr:hypothetical protein [archaeon]
MTLWLGMGTIFVCYYLCVYVTKTIPPLPHVPMISDTFVPYPADIISRIGMIGTAFLLWTIQRLFLFYSTVTVAGNSHCDKLNAWFGSLGALGLMVVAACNEDENGTIHGTGAGFFFVGQLLMMVGFTRKAFHLAADGNHSTTLKDAHVKLFSTVIATAFGVGFLLMSSDWGKYSNYIAVCEWGAVIMIFFFNASALPEFHSSLFVAEVYYPPTTFMALVDSEPAPAPAPLKEVV